MTSNKAPSLLRRHTSDKIQSLGTPSFLERLTRLISIRQEASLVERTSTFQPFHERNQLVRGRAIVGCSEREFKVRRREESERVIIDHAPGKQLACEIWRTGRVDFLEERGLILVAVVAAAAVVVERGVRSGALEGGHAALGGCGMLC